MTAFRYKAVTAKGGVVRGVMDAPSLNAVISRIRQDGNIPIAASPDRRHSALVAVLEAIRPQKRTSLRKLSLATHEWSALVGAGIELDRALGTLAGMKDIGMAAHSFLRVRESLRDGLSIADSLQKNELFPQFYVAMVRAGEIGGSLPVTLKRLSDYMVRALAVREAVLSALVYPAILMITAGFSIIFILTFVLPEFAPLFADAGQQLPLPTRVIMGASDAVREGWWLFLLASLAALYFFRRALRQPRIRMKADIWLLRVPVLGKLMFDIELERFYRMTATMLENGITLPTALGYARDALRNSAMAEAVDSAVVGVQEGQTLESQLMKLNALSPVSLDLVQIGEETGRLDEMLMRQADLDEQRVRKQLERLLALLVPGLTILLGIVIAGLIASVLVAILSVNELALR